MGATTNNEYSKQQQHLFSSHEGFLTYVMHHHYVMHHQRQSNHINDGAMMKQRK